MSKGSGTGAGSHRRVRGLYEAQYGFHSFWQAYPLSERDRAFINQELLRAIDSNESIVIKNKRVYLNELIANTDYIIINANEIEYLKRCKNKVNNYYEEMLIKNKKIIINKIKKISNAKIIIIDNNCNINNINNSKVIDFTWFYKKKYV